MLNGAKAVNILYCGLNADKFNRISICKNTENIWDILEITHNGTNLMKEKKSRSYA